jgi:hypothetical protein
MFADICLHLLRMDKILSTWTEKAREVASCLLKKIIPQFRIPVSIGSENGPPFVAEVVQLMAKRLK